jgi:hypothetical protein
MAELAQTRIVDLNERGYQNAGLYDPSGVGGTHVTSENAWRWDPVGLKLVRPS